MNAYERYEKRIRKLARLIELLKKNVLYIVAGFLVLAVGIFALLTITGNVTEEVVCKDIVYGEELSYRAGALWTDVRFEFSSVGSDERTTEAPTMPGSYVIYAYGENVFGQRKYSEREFTIKKRELILKLSGATVTYGDEIDIDEVLTYGGQLEGDNVGGISLVYDRCLIGNSSFTVDTDAITVTSADGADVTAAYDIRVSSAYVTVKRRRLVLSTPSFMKIYDATPLESDGSWKLESGSLASGDNADIRVGGSLTEVGEKPNTLTYVHITNAEGRNVSDCYEIITNAGKIKVVKGKITLRVDDLSATYVGSNITPTGVTVAEGKLYDGEHIGSVVYSGGGTDVGTYSCGIRSLAIMNNGVDVTDDYIIDVIPGKLTVLPIEISIKTSTEKRAYDGTELFGKYSVISGKTADGQYISTVSKEKIVEVGTTKNTFTLCVLDEKGVDVSNNYKFSYEYGDLTVTERYLSLAFKDTYATYSGITPSNGYYNIIDGGLAFGDGVRTTPKNEMIDVGTYLNELDLTVVNREGKDVTHCYRIDAEFGMLIIRKLDVTFTTNTELHVYNGKYVTPSSYVDLSQFIAYGHNWANVSFTVSEMLPGTYESSVEKTVRIVNADGRDVTHNFNISYKFGNLIINRRPIRIKSPSNSKVYDGTPLTYDGDFEYDKQETDEHGNDNEQGLLEGHTVVGTLENTSITDVGSIRMTVNDLKILDEKGVDVTSYYDVYKTDLGVLKVNKRNITVTSASALKNYDGTPLTDSGYSVSEGGLVSGEQLYFDVIGTITEPGSTPNTMSTIYIRKADGTDSTANYNITATTGVLTVVDPDAIDTSTGNVTTPGHESGTVGGTSQGGSSDQNPGFELDPNGTLGIGDAMPGEDISDAVNKSAFSVYSTESHVAYLKYMSFGDYLYQRWGKAPEYGSLIDNKFSYSYLTGIALRNANMRRINMKLNLNVGNYLLPYYLSTEDTGYTPQKSDTVNSGNCEGEISVFYYYYDVEKNGIPSVSLGEYANMERVYKNYVYSEYLLLPASTRKYLETVIAENDFGDTTEEKIKNILEYVRSHGVYDLGYDRSLDSSSDIAVAFLRDYNVGVCQHFATAGTALFRAAGIPARYTIGWVTRTEANKWVSQKGAAHAWVEIYIDGIGWMHVDPTPTSSIDISDILNGRTEPTESETLPEQPGNVTEPADDEIIRFRTGYTGPMFFRKLNYTNFKNGEWIYDNYSRLNEYEKAQLLFAARALELLGATEYNVKIDYMSVPEMLLLPYYATSGITELSTIGDFSYAYNGKVSMTFGFIPGMRCDSSFVGAALDEEYAEIEKAYRILVEKTYLDVDRTYFYMIQRYFPDLLKQKNSERKINYVLDTIRELRRNGLGEDIPEAASIEECLEAGYLTSDEYATTLAVLMLRMLNVPSRYVEGYLVSSVSSQTTVVRDSDMTSWMEVYVDGIGWIPVSVREDVINPFANDDDITTHAVSVTVNSAGKLYDGQPLTENGFELTNGRLLDGHTLAVETSSAQQYVGSTENAVSSFKVLDVDGNDVTHLYKIYFVSGKLNVYPLTANPIERMKGTVGQTLTLGKYSWWTGSNNCVPVFKIVEGADEGVILTDNGDLVLEKAGIYRISVSAVGVDLNGDKLYEVEPIEKFEFSVIVNEFSNVVTMDMTLDEAVTRNHQTRPKTPESFTQYGSYIGLVVEMNSATKVYDGSALTADGAVIINGRLRDGDTVEARGSGSVTFCGKSKNSCAELIIRDSKGRDVTYLYAVTVYPGTLTVETALPTVSKNTVTVGLGETLFVGELFRSDVISNYPMSISVTRDNGVVSLDGDTLRGKKIGSSVLNVTLHGCDLNGDGFYEYSQSSFSVRIETRIAAWQIVMMILFLAALVGYVLICVCERRSKAKKGTE